MTAVDRRKIAIDSYNRAQDLFYSVRTSEHDEEMLHAALISRYNWRLVGGERQFAVSDWLMSRIYAEFNDSRLALDFAMSSFSHNQDGFPGWLKASLYEGMARAYKCASKVSEFQQYKKLALDTLALEPESKDSAPIAAQIAELG